MRREGLHLDSAERHQEWHAATAVNLAIRPEPAGAAPMNGKWKILLALVASFILISSAQSLRAQDSEGALTASHLWVDKKTGQVFIKPGRNRVPLNIGNAVDTDAISNQVEQKVQAKTNDQVRAAVAETEAQQRADNAATQAQIAQMKPAWTSYLNNFQDKFRIGALAYLDYSAYTHT